MATFIGKDGIVRNSANAYAETTEWSVDSTAEPVEDTALGDEWKTFKSGSDIEKTWTFAITCHWDDTDTNGQEAATVGASISLELYPEGTTATNAKLTGTAVVDTVAIAVTRGEIVGRTISGQGTGALTIGTA